MQYAGIADACTGDNRRERGILFLRERYRNPCGCGIACEVVAVGVIVYERSGAFVKLPVCYQTFGVYGNEECLVFIAQLGVCKYAVPYSGFTNAAREPALVVV